MLNKFYLYILRAFTVGWNAGLIALTPLLKDTYNLTLLDIGYLTMALTVSSIFSALAASKLNMLIGTKSLLLLSVGVQGFVWIGFLFPKYPGILLIMFIIAGLSSGLLDPVLSAYVARNAKPHERSKAIGDYGAASDIGRVILTAMLTLLFGMWPYAFAVLIQIAVTLALVGYLHSQKLDATKPIQAKTQPVHTSYPKLLTHQKYLLTVSAGLLDTFSSSSIFIFLPFLLAEKGVNINLSGLYTSLFFAGYFVGRIFLSRLGDKHGTSRMLVFAELAMSLLIGSLLFIKTYWIILINIFLLGVFTRGTVPLIKAMVAESLDDSEFETGYGLYSSFMRTSNAMSRPVYSLLGSFFGIGSVFFLSAVLAAMTSLPAGIFYRKNSES